MSLFFTSCERIMRIFLAFTVDRASKQSHKTINENRKANLDNENIFIFISFLIPPRNLKHQKILIDIFNSPVGFVMSRLRQSREICECGIQAETIPRKTETCLIQINSFCISNETNLDFSSQLSSPNWTNPTRSSSSRLQNVPNSRRQTPKLPNDDEVPAEHLSGNNVSWCRKWKVLRCYVYWSSPWICPSKVVNRRAIWCFVIKVRSINSIFKEKE